ncbi:MAG: K+/H+ antiporter subunit F [Chromatiales bacterium]|nr:K+/H+ antiporter subunit F [Chromatiales bacterium]
MIEVAANLAIGMLALAMLLAAFRLWRGPDVLDRVLALDTLYIDALALLVVLGVRMNDAVYFEAALLIGLLGFVGTVALARYLLRGDIID